MNVYLGAFFLFLLSAACFFTFYNTGQHQGLFLILGGFNAGLGCAVFLAKRYMK